MRIQLKKWVVPASVGTISFGVGVGVGHILAQRGIKNEVQILTDELKRQGEIITRQSEEIESLQVQLGFKLEDHTDKLNSLVQQASRSIKQSKDDNVSINHPSNGRVNLPLIANEDDDSLVVNIFQEEDDDWDYDVEVPLRGPEHPYIIHRDEYFANELDYAQVSLMYYAGDNILCDEHDVPVYNPDKIVGKLIFGHGSRDPSIVYICNPKIEVEYEVLFDPGTYQSEVLGEPELKHGNRVPKFRIE